MELLVVSLVRNIRFEDLADFGGDSMISFICIGLRDRDVLITIRMKGVSVLGRPPT